MAERRTVSAQQEAGGVLRINKGRLLLISTRQRSATLETGPRERVEKLKIAEESRCNRLESVAPCFSLEAITEFRKRPRAHLFLHPFFAYLSLGCSSPGRPFFHEKTRRSNKGPSATGEH